MSGFDLNQLGNMAQGFLNNNNNQNQQQGDNNNNQQQQHQGGNGGFDVGQLAGLAQNFSSGNHDSSLFSQAASFLQNQGGNHNVDEQRLMQDHEDVNNNPGSNSAGQIGNAAVLSAIKSVLGGGGNNNNSGGGFQQKLVSAAMSHAADLYDKKDGEGQAQGNKQDAVNQAAQMAMGLAMKNPAMLAGLVGGGNSGGLGALASMLGK
ncbi:uncharacterized protein PAN0_006d2894 [Moesziomyces antarcticus]|uniref:Uncharacterized protein n=2 Tax=Pseudozyma antarctica TaxID=84753 RepID=A0A5C3FMQ8_PSEA2|nr:uncharacterized protein PAN0_006d2894 [Moesziomyces antarcticus]GAK64679.1 conserved hypothetical protein [Moesziomyces antarcticus]SPO45664.1 uncharacterized protein PSANT_03350 [Moesziomyces antarcticus]